MSKRRKPGQNRNVARAEAELRRARLRDLSSFSTISRDHRYGSSRTRWTTGGTVVVQADQREPSDFLLDRVGDQLIQSWSDSSP
jgi:hypothetical protein